MSNQAYEKSKNLTKIEKEVIQKLLNDYKGRVVYNLYL